MEINAISIKNFILSNGIDIVRIADTNNLVLASPPRPATALMPTAKSVIVMAVAHSLGAVYAPDIMLWTRNKMQTSRILDETAEKVSRILEKNDFLSLSVSADKPVEIHKTNPETGKKFKQTKVIGQFSHKHAAVSCGMGEIGNNNLLLTPEFGPHQRLCSIITEAPLEIDKPQNFGLCKKCRKCENACPSGALKNGKYDVDICFNYWAYGWKRSMPRSLKDWFGFIKMLKTQAKHRDFIIEIGQTYITDVDNCIECMRACPVGENWKSLRPKTMRPQKTMGI
ncbi:MAG: 4Fe-4S binding protein [Desulfobacterales bacterium]|nr:4Fe-4S binding protein [Desulfobacterales bacterium]